MAEAMAGETGKPFIFVDPGAFNNMFFGVGVLKVKSLFRKLRKLALRYGGVVVFFDEADAGQLLLVLGTSIALKVYPEGASSGDKYYYGDAIITGSNISASFDGMVEAEVTFTGTGALTFGTA